MTSSTNAVGQSDSTFLLMTYWIAVEIEVYLFIFTVPVVSHPNKRLNAAAIKCFPGHSWVSIPRVPQEYGLQAALMNDLQATKTQQILYFPASVCVLEM